MITAGADVGSKTVKVVILKDGKIAGKGIAIAGLEAEGAWENAWADALKEAGISRNDINKTVATGARLKEVKGFDEEMSMVTADAMAMHKLNPEIKTVLDVGAEEGRAIKVDKDGKVSDFAVNEKCAAGAGAFMEAMSRAMQVSIEQFGEEALKSTANLPINAQCAVFAESEVVSLVHEETPRPDICKAVCDGVSDRLASMARRVVVEPKVAFVGGAAKGMGLRRSLKEALELTEVYFPDDIEFVAAYGCALKAAE
ncbi:putative (R)-2-hydroxyglutaryl-CoA dehydratase activator [uncultured Desulfobacterium sp.]|uniref:Putative (R)-2-hydroxyglutaryl-CoA dehydratase activator n=1 Tax=uncultured Desulfobacterium sp. TaxID=201089 RepID=A0A445MVS8_9BACT|nr:putative (R)-2-hydroxyglutaryl-CoA dehydratase activator [uncultured Desulfobacterium sp.]